MFTKRISPIRSESGKELVDLKLDACSNPNRFFEGADKFYEFETVDSSFGDPHMNSNVDALVDGANTTRPEDAEDESPAKRRRTDDRANLSDDSSSEVKPRKRLIRLKSNSNEKTKRRVVRSRINIERFFDNDVAVGLAEGEKDEMGGNSRQHDENGDSDGETSDVSSESVTEKLKRVGLEKNFTPSTRRIDKGIFEAASQNLYSEENLALPLSARIASLLRCCMLSFIAANNPIQIIPFEVTRVGNHVPREWSRKHCDSIPSNESKYNLKRM